VVTIAACVIVACGVTTGVIVANLNNDDDVAVIAGADTAEPTTAAAITTITTTATTISETTVPLTYATSPVAVNSDEDFVLSISVEETTLRQGEEFRVNVALLNNTSQAVEINYFVLFDYSIPNYNKWCCGYGCIGSECESGLLVAPFDLPEPTAMLIESGDVILSTQSVGRRLPIGTHELRFSAMFWLDNSTDNTVIRSNTVLITVENSDCDCIEWGGEWVNAEGVVGTIRITSFDENPIDEFSYLVNGNPNHWISKDFAQNMVVGRTYAMLSFNTFMGEVVTAVRCLECVPSPN
jgi:hypothetical protein